MDDVQLANYIAGIEPGPIEAGRVDREIARILGVQTGTIIWLSDWTLTKTRYRHPEIDFGDYRKIPEIISRGFVTSGNKIRSVDICHVNITSEKFRLWRICLKSTARSEVFVTMFHRLKMKEARRLYRRALKKESLLRDHQDQLARRLLHRTSRV